ncbi:MAG TPA: tRNA (adenosine(37)-N6)-threonylcarbamoyltransferase complex transferase subunit TsaD [Buchnera sp. (in: enterobacteria)]|nr:tRNA (adenosine(37)-N6)-threonylcarbamoyltransferase complex transferase subunit TsaD [Buchnera sp. (in: enterobacteria)]
MKILGIETSCDDTGIAVYDNKFGLIINKLHSQSSFHDKYGGVVPEIAARNHLDQIFLFLQKFKNKQNFFNSIDSIAYTAGPGLAGSLLVGATVACSLAFSLDVPVIPVNHIEGHLLSPMLDNKNLNFPFLGLLISGGNTQLIYAKKIGVYELLGKTLDIAVGNLFDKIAKALGLKYPGGPNISKLAKFGRNGIFKFPRPMLTNSNLNFSFSGLRTFIEKLIKCSDKSFQIKSDIALELEETIIEIFIFKVYRALKLLNLKNLVIVGGVSANSRLRNCFFDFSKKNNFNLFLASKKYCTDNAAMISYVGCLKFRSGIYSTNTDVFVDPKWCINNLNR